MRLIDANVLVEFVGTRTTSWIYKPDLFWAIEQQPTVDAVVLPCKIGADVYIIHSKVNFDLNVLCGHPENNKVHHQKVANIVFIEDGWYITGSADKEYGTGRILLDRFYKETWFLTKEEAEAALAKMGRKEDE